MSYTEIQDRNGKKYYYRVKSIKKRGKVSKKRIYLGSNLPQNKLKKASHILSRRAKNSILYHCTEFN